MPSALILTDPRFEAINDDLLNIGVNAGHFTNGIYGGPADLMIPTLLAGFEDIRWAELQEDHPLSFFEDTAYIVGMNDDASVRINSNLGVLAGKKPASAPSYAERAELIGGVLAEQNPDKKVIVIPYSEATPKQLYQHLDQSSFGMASLHKWGYGTGEKPEPIIGAEHFRYVKAHPFPNDTKDINPACYGITPENPQQRIDEISALTQRYGGNGRTIITDQNRVGFEVRSAAFAHLRATPMVVVPSTLKLGIF